MLTDQERMNNALKEMLFNEDLMAKKYAAMAQQITDPKIKTVKISLNVVIIEGKTRWAFVWERMKDEYKGRKIHV